MNVKEAITNRRAYRSFDPVEITDDMIKDFSELAQVAPSCMNKQPWKFVFIFEKEQLEKLFSTLSPGNKWAEKASLIIGTFSKPKDDCIIGERNYFLFDTGMATAFIVLRATELGLIAHPIAGFNETKAKEILNIPDDYQLITLIIIGKHSKEINPVLSEPMQLGEKNRPPRKSIEEFTFMNRYESD